MSANGKIALSAFVMSVATFISRVLGFIRDMIVARFFGASGVSDSFFVAFRVPNLLRELFAEGSMSSGFIPVLTQYRTNKGDAEAIDLVRVTFTFIVIVIGLLCVLGIVFAGPIVRLIAPGFVNDPAKFAGTVTLTQTMFPFLLFVSLSALTMGALNTKKKFFVPAMASACFNVAIIVTIIAFYDRFREPVMAVAVGVTVGGLAQFVWQLPIFFKNNYSLRPNFRFSHPGLKRIGALVFPAAAGTAVAQFNIFMSTILASYLPTGSITYLYYAMRLIQFPVGIFGVAMGMAVLPALSEHASRGDFETLTGDFAFSLKLLFAITLPSMVGLIVLAEPIVSTLLQRGQFDHAAVVATASALVCYSAGIWAMVGVRVVASTFYAMQDTKTPVKTAIFSVLINLLLSIILMQPLSHAGLALANALASMLNFSLLFYMLRGRLLTLNTGDIGVAFVKTLIASVVMGAVGWYMVRLWHWGAGESGFGRAAFLACTIALCMVAYTVVAWALRSEEIRYIFQMVMARMRGRRFKHQEAADG
ncbi:MAG: murein biosynthesis integral membrane protein MurJ [Nitrospirae bacterium]|uniref:murein biosynthesis integral membrane protein MurJ n=1 Tax=Candidatus Magnetobacterium casense TaxID=1455061 RepID=UPI0005916472|nr:murein biosynthesis integral membrane protein MurJ [Candidatus Magnetobacterium casensis]MBF0338585.1 murein biosynthesis integral membrane protein MurJ [Nitrospirota bacterium]